MEPQEIHIAALIIITYWELWFLCMCLHHRLNVPMLPEDLPLCLSTDECLHVTLVQSQSWPDCGFWLRWVSSASTEVMVLTETPCLSDRGQWVTYSLPLLLKAWRQETDIARRLESDVVWNAVSHQSVSKCDSTNSNCFHSERGECCCSAGLGRCGFECASRCCIK